MAVTMFNLPLWSSIDNARVGDIIDLQTGFANTALAAMNSYIESIVNFSIQDINIPIPAAMATGLDFDFSQEAFDDILNRKPIAPVIDDIVVSFPSPPTINVPSIDLVILSGLWDTICTKLNSDLANGGYGIDTADEEAIWERSKEREKLEYDAQVSEADEVYAGFGYTMPPGVAMKAKLIAKQTYQGKMATLNREMTLKRADLYVQARQFVIENGVKFGTFFADIAKVLADVYKSEMDGAVAHANVQKEINLGKIEEFKALTEAYTAEIRGVTSLYDLASSQQEREIRMQVAVLQANIEIARLYLTQEVEQAKLRLSGATSIADVFKAICASALGTIHASASLSSGFNVGYSYDKREAVNQSYNENATVA
jgi:D-ribose pyranose/furanose isomerase RbsD